jgi:spore coat polysaccharide biosynthesis predicted glycosyltransferase SpsG
VNDVHADATSGPPSREGAAKPSGPPDLRLAAFAFDEGPGAGLGHRRRMEALAAAATSRGIECGLIPLGSGVRPSGDVVVVDSYRVRADDRMFAGARVVAAVDDLARDLAVDLVVDPSPGALGAPHRRARRVLAGSAYALVPPLDARVIEAPVDQPVDRVLVTTGAADARGIGAEIAASLAAVLPGTEVRLVVGPWGAPDVPAGVVPVHAPEGLAFELAAAGIVVTAGGVALLEACLLGRPIVALALAGNQRRAVVGLERESAVMVATPETVAGAVTALVKDDHRRIALARAARVAINGDGAERVIAVLEQLTSRVGSTR